MRIFAWSSIVVALIGIISDIALADWFDIGYKALVIMWAKVYLATDDVYAARPLR